MKKQKILAFTILTTLLLAGCQNTSSQENAVLEDQITQLEQQVTDLKEENKELIVGNEKVSKDTISTQEDFETLEKEVSDMVASIQQTTPSGTQEEKRAQFFELEKALDALDNRLEIYEDLTEDQYETGEISVNDFRTMEREIEQLEDALDTAEDDLERLFGYID